MSQFLQPPSSLGLYNSHLQWLALQNTVKETPGFTDPDGYTRASLVVQRKESVCVQEMQETGV